MSETYRYKEQTIDYEIIYKKRKTMGIYLDVYGNIELRVPKDTTDEQIINMLENKWSWIIKNQKECRERTKGFKKKVYEEGESFLFLGDNYSIRIFEDETITVEGVGLVDTELHIKIKNYDEELIKKLMKQFYTRQCKALVEKRIRQYQPNFKVKPRGIKISSNKKTWGTCNSKRELTFNWKLVMAPIEVLDYVVVHEMCHMVHLNHDRSFWRLVGKYIPNYEEKQEWLRQSHWKMVV